MMKSEIINRNNFLKQIGFSGAALFAVMCAGGTMSSCQNESGVTPLAGDITLDLTASQYAALLKNGGYVVLSSQNVVVARTNTGTYAAVTLICSHEQQRQITYRTSEFYCTAHGARFDNSGKGLNSEGKKGLTVYQTSVSGNILTIKAS
ncbi:Rieske 2Fe-2S domain-containing protein [Runella sp.]|jgi:nitrite reductase/ring-hydroxylating ferredoxin subunit|uniref:QcrA and Rieske domain-containing protein n=1 Tax=Runella sp. TaxID=1960881 RepID=UPI00261F7849|nr:Rieske 2Fe-2S domain-containing protein [Runella sp.]